MTARVRKGWLMLCDTAGLQCHRPLLGGDRTGDRRSLDCLAGISTKHRELAGRGTAPRIDDQSRRFAATSAAGAIHKRRRVNTTFRIGR